MTPEGAEALKATIRHSVPLIVALIVLGIVAVNVFDQLRGARYDANARVVINTGPFSSIRTGAHPAPVDPKRFQRMAALRVAGTPRVYALAAGRSGGKLGRADSLHAAIGVTGDPASDAITFTASSSTRETSVGIVNAVASAYVAIRGRLASSQIRNRIDELANSMTARPPGNRRRAGRLLSKIDELNVLSANASHAELVRRAGGASQVSPAPVKDSVLGLALGLIAALLVVAIRGAIETVLAGMRSHGSLGANRAPSYFRDG